MRTKATEPCRRVRRRGADDKGPDEIFAICHVARVYRLGQVDGLVTIRTRQPLDGPVRVDAADRRVDTGEYPLGLSERIREDDRCLFSLLISSPPRAYLVEYLLGGGPSIDRKAKGRLGDKEVAL